MHFSPQENITLNVAINPESKVFYNLRGLTWFHNGNQLSSGGGLVISENQTELNIYRTTKDNEGIYEARFTGLLVQPYSQMCEAVLLDLLVHYPVLSAAVFHLSSTQEGMVCFHMNPIHPNIAPI